MKLIAQKSHYVIVLSQTSKDFLVNQCSILSDKIFVIQHGIPDVNFINPKTTKLRNEINSDLVFISSGHLRPSKGYDFTLKALAQYKKVNNKFKFLILGTYQKQFEEGKAYKNYLENLILKLNLKDNIIWIDRYLPIKELLEYIIASDIGLVTYTEPNHNSSGVLPLILGCGRAVITTNFEYALNLKKSMEDCIQLAEINNSKSIFNSILAMVKSENYYENLMNVSYSKTRDWLWINSAKQYSNCFDLLKTNFQMLINIKAASPMRDGFLFWNDF